MIQNNTGKEKILLFIPGYNCEKQISRVLGQLDNEILTYISKVIMVNNRSTDNTEQSVIDWGRQHKEVDFALLRNDDNYNLGGSHKVVFDYAINGDFDYIIVLHGDDQGNIHDLLPLLRNGIYTDFDCCLGARFMKGSKLYGYSNLRIIANNCFNLWFSIVTGRRILDLGSGLNMYKVDSLKSLYFLRYPDRLFFNDVMILGAVYYKQKIKFFPISWKEEDQVSNVKLFSFGMELLKMTLFFIFRRKAYMQSDMRQKTVEKYTYQVIYEHQKALGDSQT